MDLFFKADGFVKVSSSLTDTYLCMRTHYVGACFGYDNFFKARHIVIKAEFFRMLVVAIVHF